MKGKTMNPWKLWIGITLYWLIIIVLAYDIVWGYPWLTR